jgi:hypothetical protein
MEKIKPTSEPALAGFSMARKKAGCDDDGLRARHESHETAKGRKHETKNSESRLADEFHRLRAFRLSRFRDSFLANNDIFSRSQLRPVQRPTNNPA